MPYAMKWEDGGVHIEFQSHVTGKEIKQAGDAVYGNKQFDRIRYQIFDFTDAVEFKISLDEMKEIAAIDSVAATINSTMRLAIVSNSETIDTAIALYDANTPDSPWTTEGFRSLSEARSWIEVAI